jgi:hypothetical protein
MKKFELSLGSFSGGIFYHLKAAVYSKRLWDSHRDQVDHFLQAWFRHLEGENKNFKADEEFLILVGPSGGYSLPENFLKKFKKVIAYEPDQMARRIFEKRFGIFPEWSNEIFDPATTVFPNGLILFCNVLGQLKIESVPAFKSQLEKNLYGRKWASYHDAFSVQCSKSQRVHFKIPSLAGESLPKIHERMMQDWLQVSQWGIRLGKNKKHNLTILDHEARQFFTDKGIEYFYWMWKITPAQTHLIEGTFYRQIFVERE